MENKELMTIDFNRGEVVKTLKATVAQGLTDAEFLLFAEHCKGTGLNPFKREVWAIKVSGRLQLMTGIGGYFTIANRHPKFDGYEEGYVSKDGQELPDTYAGNDYIGAWCKVYRKDRKVPAKGVAFMAEYNKGHGNWKTMPRVMIMKCAESIALRKAFPQELNGTYTAEEMPREFAPPKDDGGNSGAPAVVVADDLPKPKKSSEWDGSEKVGTGKNAESQWADLNDNQLFWYRDECKNKALKANAEKELARRFKLESPDFDDINKEAENFKDDGFSEEHNNLWK